MDIVDFVKKVVTESGSQTAVARKCGVSQGTVHKLINGDHQPDLLTIQKIAKAYGKPLSMFVDGMDSPKNDGQLDRIEQLLIRILSAVDVKGEL